MGFIQVPHLDGHSRPCLRAKACPSYYIVGLSSQKTVRMERVYLELAHLSHLLNQNGNGHDLCRKGNKNHSDTQEKLDPSCSTREQCGAQRTWGKQDRRRPLSNSFSWGGKSRAGSECTSFSDWIACWEHPFESWVYLSSRRPLPMQH